jgi:hypothetical protein
LYNDINEAVQYLDTLHGTYTKVSYKTNSLYRACEQLLTDQTKLLNITECIENRLSYFDDVDRFSKVIDFMFYEGNIDECILIVLESIYETIRIRYKTINSDINTY